MECKYPNIPNRQVNPTGERQIQAIRQELKKLKKAYRNAKDEDKLGLQELADKATELRKAETARKNRRKRAKKGLHL
ncbi:hypothetical protein DPMN_046341 [Dreissena polymorpha]|uniref:Uncharacterized protein n=1 Tax=Dreissena polymorpha TaxID=45954 RepID=A0A9D4D7N5_DREPO|nr:hypothetical protein DPMN_046341 [Dreissena polymorpha]